MSIGERIKEARDAKGWVRFELSQASGAREMDIYAWEKNIRKPRVESLKKIAEALEVTIDALTED